MPLPTPTFTLVLALCAASVPALAQQPPAASGHYIFAWAGDVAHKGNDFLAVIDGDPASASYGRLLTTLVTDQPTVQIHHTEYVMPESGMLFANDHAAGRTFIFNIRDPLHPAIAASFGDLAGYSHPHSYVRLPNGHVLVTFQHGHSHGAHAVEQLGQSGGLLELDNGGQVIRAVSNADPAFPDALLTPYSLVVLPEIDRVVSTNSSMHDENVFNGVTYQVWRLSDLKLLKTAYFDPGMNHYGHVSPEEPRRGPDGSVFVQTLGCGLERVTAIDTDNPNSKLVHTFPGSWCGVPTIVGHYLIQSVQATHGLIVLDLTEPGHPVEVSRLKIDDAILPHWTGWDAKAQRLVVTGYGEHRLFLLKFDQTNGALGMDTAFHDDDGTPGFNFDNRHWPHGWAGSAIPHGVVFSR